MDVSDEVRAAAKRIARWEACCKTGDIDEHEYLKEPDRQWNDESPVIDWAVARIEADDAEQAERARPIDEEWLASIGWKAIGNIWYPPACHWGKNITMPVVLWCRVDGTIRLVGGNEWSSENDATRGQLIDLLAALKGGAK